MESMSKNKDKKSLFKCLKNTIGFNNSFSVVTKPKHITTDPVLGYLAVADKDGVAMLSSTLATTNDTVRECGIYRRKKGKGTWLALRSTTTLMKRMLSRRKTSKDHLPLSRSTNNLEEVSEFSNPRCKSTPLIDLNGSSTFDSSFAFTNSSSLSSICPTHPKQLVSSLFSHMSIPLIGTDVTKQKQCGVKDERKGHYGSNIVFYMLLIILLVLVVWGKFFAISCTVIWFYLMSDSWRRPCNEFELEKCMLEKSHSYVSPASNSSMSKIERGQSI